MAENETLAELLRRRGEQFVSLPTEATRFLTDPQGILKLLGLKPNERLSGFSAGYAGVPQKSPSDIGVVDPRNIEYSKGYGSGEEMGMMTALASPLAPLAKPVGKALGKQAYEMTEDMLAKQGLMPSVVPRNLSETEKLANALRTNTIGNQPFDPRFDPRKLEQERLKQLTTKIEPYQQYQPPQVSLADFEGRPFITSMSDRTAAGGNLVGINDVNLKRPVNLMGGQDYMFNNPGQVWASAQSPVKQLIKNADLLKEVTGQNPLYIPWRMAPTGGDFAHMTGETMLSYAESALNKGEKKAINKEIKEFIPDWKGLDSVESIEQFRKAPDRVRKAIKRTLDKNFRNEGGLSIGESRLSVTDPRQLNAPTGGVMNVGEIFANQPMIMQSGHPSYPRGLPGQGLGTLPDNTNIFELLPNVVKERNIANPKQPGTTDIRALQMKPYAGILTPQVLKSLGY